MKTLGYESVLGYTNRFDKTGISNTSGSPLYNEQKTGVGGIAGQTATST